MQCFVYASARKPNTFVWLAERDNVDCLPESLVLMLGELRFVVEVQLHEQRKLPFEDADVVREHLRSRGWHLQLPPSDTLATCTQNDDRRSARSDRDDD